MYGEIFTTKKINKALLYNENKLKSGQAECILAENFLQQPDQLSGQEKLFRFRQRTILNERAPTNGLHIILHFHSTDRLDKEKMQVLTKRYMEGLGFRKQPYLGYRHKDTAHPHVHVVTTNIQANGIRIDLDKDDLLRSHQLTRELEKEFSLFQSAAHKLSLSDLSGEEEARQVIYGESGVKKAICEVLQAVIDRYTYTSLEEFNALLRLYNIRAERGKESSALYQNKGLIYRILREDGKRVTPIEASKLLVKSTLSNLEKQFFLNQPSSQEKRGRISSEIDWILGNGPKDWAGLQDALEREGINIVLLRERTNGPEAVYFIDHETKCAISGANLGNRYTLSALKQRCEKGKIHQKLQPDHKLRQEKQGEESFYRKVLGDMFDFSADSLKDEEMHLRQKLRL